MTSNKITSACNMRSPTTGKDTADNVVYDREDEHYWQRRILGSYASGRSYLSMTTASSSGLQTPADEVHNLTLFKHQDEEPDDGAIYFAPKSKRVNRLPLQGVEKKSLRPAQRPEFQPSAHLKAQTTEKFSTRSISRSTRAQRPALQIDLGAVARRLEKIRMGTPEPTHLSYSPAPWDSQ